MTDGQRTLQFGIIGCGHIVQSVHLPAWQSIKLARLKAICDSSQSALGSLAARYPKARQYSDVDRFLDEADDLDFVVLATPGDSHVTIGERVLRRKLHLLCEKPLALNEKDAGHLYDVAEQEGVTLTPIQNYKYRDTVMRALACKESGALGNVSFVTVLSRSGALADEPAGWRKGEREQRVLLFDYGIHFVHLAIQFAGPVSSLRFVDAEVNGAGLKYVAFGTLHEGGCHGLFELMLDASSSRSEVEVLGESGGLALDFFPHGLRILPRRDTPLHRGRGDFRRLLGYARGLVGERLAGRIPDRAAPHESLFSAFIQCLRGAAPNPVSKSEVLQTISLLDEVAERAYSSTGVPNEGSSPPN